MRAAGRHTVPPLILKRVRRPPPDPDSTSQTRQPPSTMRPALPCSPGNRRPPVMPPFLHTDPTAAARRRRSLVKQTVVPRSRPRRPSTAKRGRGDSRKGPQLAGGLRREGVAEGRGCRGKGLQREGLCEHTNNELPHVTKFPKYQRFTPIIGNISNHKLPIS